MTDPTRTDVEDPKGTKVPPTETREFVEAAFLLSMWSILVANEGVIRFVQRGAPRAVDLFRSAMPNRFTGAFLGGLFEVIFGLFGLCVGLAAGVMGYYSKQLTLVLMVTQNILGWYVFIGYVFVIPSYGIAAIASPYGDLSLGATKFMGVLGILTSVAFCLALQGGQFVFMARLIAYGSDIDFLKQRSGAKMRAIFWNCNLALAGLWTTIQACLVINGADGGITPPFMAPPNVGRIPVYLLITGLLMCLWPLLGITVTLTGRLSIVRQYVAVTFLSFLFIYVHYTIGQLGFLANVSSKVSPAGSAGPAAGAAMHNGLVMMVCFLGPYFMLKHAQEADY